MTRAARVDANQAELVAIARKCGASVLHLHTLGRGAPDILLGHRGRNLLVEAKDGSKPPSRRRLTPDEAEFHSDWKGQVTIIESVDDLIALLNGKPAADLAGRGGRDE